MGKVINIFAADQGSPTNFSLLKANELVPLVKRYTEEAIQETQKISLKLEYLEANSQPYKALSKIHDQIILRWAERIHRLGGLAKGLWTVDFDTGKGYLCWSFPEDKIEHYHSYEGGYKNRERIQTLESVLEKQQQQSPPSPGPSAPIY